MTVRSYAALFTFALAAAAVGPTAAQDSPSLTDPAQSPGAPPTAEPPPETVVAIINGAKITRADVIASAQSLPPQYQQQIDAIFPALIDRIVDLTLLSEEGRKQNLENDGEVKARVAQFTDQVIQEVVIRRHIEMMMTEEAILARFQKFIAESPPQSEVHALHILVATEAEAADVIARLAGGADFSALAKERSTDPSAKQNGGDLGFFGSGDMVPEFEKAAFGLKTGESSTAPVRTQFGWHVIKVVDRRDKAAPTLEQARKEIEDILSGELVAGYVSSLRGGATIEVFNPDGTPKTAPAEQPQ